MLALVNENCIGCGLCADISPEVFQMDEGVAKTKETQIAPEFQDSALDAEKGCPVNAITVS